MTEPVFRSDVAVELVNASGDEQDIVRAARVSTLGAEAERSEAQGLVRYLVREGHTSPLEHTMLTFRMEVPLFVQNQLVRHRMASFNIESGRYKEMAPEFYVPHKDRKVRQVGKTGAYEFVADRVLNKLVRSVVRSASRGTWSTYEFLLDRGVAKELARIILPLNLYSTLYMTVNLHSALNIIKLRTWAYGSKPQAEIAAVGDQIKAIVTERFPTVMAQYDDNMKEKA